MKHPLLIYIILFACCQLHAQRRNEQVLYYTSVSDTLIWYNKELQSQVKDAHGNFIHFQLSSRNDHVTLNTEKQFAQSRSRLNIFQFGFGAAQEIWERKYGQRFPEEILLQKIDSFRNERSWVTYVHGNIYRDSIFMERSGELPVMGPIDSTIPMDSVEDRRTGTQEEDKIFEAIGWLDGEFTGGVKALQALLNEQMRDTRFEIGPADSIIYFQGVIKRDSMLYDIVLLEPSQETAYTKRLAEILAMPKRQWLPLRRERTINAYILIYIRVKCDGTLDIDYD